jgi:dihydrofolate synthase/folylpolyglutamate synthase
MTDPFLRFVRSGIRPGLARIRKLLVALDHPERSFKTILVAGSNGKGSTAAYLSSILQLAGYRTGLFTSPHLMSVSERFRVDGVLADASDLRRFLRLHGSACRRVGATYFEATTACALWWFASERVEWAILEIGLGGRWDACNAVDPELSVITSIAREHTDYLGPTLAHVAREKAQVARPGRPVVVGSLAISAGRALRAELRRIGARPHTLHQDFDIRNARFTPSQGQGTLVDRRGQVRFRTGLLGENAVANAALAAESVRVLAAEGAVSKSRTDLDRAVRAGVAATRWPGRLQIVRRHPLVIADVAHNQAAFEKLVSDWQNLWPRQRPHIVGGLLGGKPATAIGRLLSRIAGSLTVVAPESPRAIPPNQLADTWRRSFPGVQVAASLDAALQTAMAAAGRRGSVLVCGSHYLVGPALESLSRLP